MYEKGYIDILGCPTIDPNLLGHPAGVTPCHCAGKGIQFELLPSLPRHLVRRHTL